VFVSSSEFIDNSDAIALGAGSNSSGDSLRIENSTIIGVWNTAINANVRNCKIKIHKSIIKNCYGTAINHHLSDPVITMTRSLIKNSGHPFNLYQDNYSNSPRWGGELLVDHSTIVDNNYYSIFGSGDEGLYNITIQNSIFANDPQIEIKYVGNGLVIENSAFEMGENGINTTHSTYNSLGLVNVVTEGILSTGPNGELNSNCSSVDAGSLGQFDGFMPPGIGGVRADLGMYGGPGNTIWGGLGIPPGEPVIDQIVDLPNDQGGYVGVQYSGSIFDYDHSGYDIDSYSFWRELDVQNMGIGQDALGSEINSYRSFGRDSYWENMGEMDAQGFENYGFSALTISDSSSDGIFWSKYLVVAHTPDDDIFFVSSVDSGYSVDNIAPVAPAQFSVNFDEGLMSASWVDDVNPDVVQYDVYKDGDSFLQIQETEFTDNFSLGDSAEYQIRGIDENDNTGEFSEPYVVSYGKKGDITWDGIINVLDVTKIIYHILFPEDDVSTEEYWAGDFNGDEQINVVDVTPVVDFILGGFLSDLENTGGQTVALINDNQLILNSDRPITGIQIKLNGSNTVSNLTNLSMASHGNQIILYSSEGQFLQGINVPILDLSSDMVIEDLIIVDNLGERVSTVLKIVEEDVVPNVFKIHQNYPNPFNPATLVKVDVNEPIDVMVSVYDVMGREISVLVNEQLHPGYHQFIWDGTDNRGMKAGSGLYFIMVQTPEITRTMKATLLR